MKKCVILSVFFFAAAVHVYGQGVTGIPAGKKVVTAKNYFLYNTKMTKVPVPSSAGSNGYIYRMPVNVENISQADKRLSPMKEPPRMPANAKRALL